MIHSVASTVVVRESTQLPALMGKVRRKIAEAESLEECVDLRAQVAALSVIVQKARMTREQVNEIAVANLEAERKAGRMLRVLHLAGGRRRGRSCDDRPTLESLGIEPNQSSRWQRLCQVPEEEFHRYVEGTVRSGHIVSSEGLLRVWRQVRQRNKASRRGTKSVQPAHATRVGGQVDELINELRNHRQNVLSRLEDDSTLVDGKLVVPVPEARYIAKLLGEMEGHLCSLRKMLAQDRCGSPTPCRFKIT